MNQILLDSLFSSCVLNYVNFVNINLCSYVYEQDLYVSGISTTYHPLIDSLVSDCNNEGRCISKLSTAFMYVPDLHIFLHIYTSTTTVEVMASLLYLSKQNMIITFRITKTISVYMLDPFVATLLLFCIGYSYFLVVEMYSYIF